MVYTATSANNSTVDTYLGHEQAVNQPSVPNSVSPQVEAHQQPIQPQNEPEQPKPEVLMGIVQLQKSQLDEATAQLQALHTQYQQLQAQNEQLCALAQKPKRSILFGFITSDLPLFQTTLRGVTLATCTLAILYAAVLRPIAQREAIAAYEQQTLEHIMQSVQSGRNAAEVLNDLLVSLGYEAEQ